MTSSGSVLDSGFSVPASLFYAYIIAPILAKVKHFFRLFSQFNAWLFGGKVLYLALNNRGMNYDREKRKIKS